MENKEYYGLYKQIFELELSGKIEEASNLRKNVLSQVGFESDDLSVLEQGILNISHNQSTPPSEITKEDIDKKEVIQNKINEYSLKIKPVLKNIHVFLNTPEIKAKKFRKVFSIFMKYADNLTYNTLVKLTQEDLNLLKSRMLKALSSYLTHVFIEQEKSVDNVIGNLGCEVFVDIIKDTLNLESIESMDLLISFIRMIC